MKRASSPMQGFTIIETVLFLGVTGLMITAMFIGIGSSIGSQRYKDSVESFKSVLQQQYASVASVQNTRQGNWACTPSGSALRVQLDDTGGAAGATSRGQAACDILGKYVKITGSKIESYTVLGYKSGALVGDNDVEKLAGSGYMLGVSSSDAGVSEMEWGTKLAWSNNTATGDTRPAGVSGGDRSIALMVLRSPDSGAVYTFSSNTVTSDVPSNTQLKSMLVAGEAIPGRAKRVLCINPDGLLLTKQRAVIIDAYAADGSAVRVATQNDFSGGDPC